MNIEPFRIAIPDARWAERYYNLKRWTHFEHGGHFAPMERPQALVADMRAFFATLRD